MTDGKKKLNEVPVQNGDAILVYRLPASSDQCSAVQESASGATATEGAAAGGGVSVGPIDAEMAAEFEALPEDRRRRLIHEANALREALLSRPEEVATLQEKNPILADALVTGKLRLSVFNLSLSTVVFCLIPPRLKNVFLAFLTKVTSKVSLPRCITCDEFKRNSRK